jgi:hypothetical protein
LVPRLYDRAMPRPRPLVPAFLALLFALGPIACKRVSADVDGQLASPGAEKAKGKRAKSRDAKLPEYVLLPWHTELYSAPNPDALVTVLRDPGEGSGCAVKLVGSEGDWWIIETIDDSALAEYQGAQPILGFDFYRLQLYVRAGAGSELHRIPPGPDTPESRAAQDDAPSDDPDDARQAALDEAAEFGMIGLLGASSLGDPPLQSGYRSGHETDWRVSPQAQVFWPDGRLAGEVRSEHAFVEPGNPDGSGELLCFDVHTGTTENYAGQLCFARASVREAEVMYPGGIFGGFNDDSDVWGGLTGAEIGEAYGSGGLGLVGTGSGGGGSGEGTIGDVGMIGQGGGGGSGSGYGSGGGGFGSTDITQVKVGSPTTTGKLDKDICRRIIRAHINEARSCWNSEKPAGASSGKLSLTLEIAADGTVSKATSKPESSDLDGVARCVEKAAAKWKFVEDGEGTASVSLDFEHESIR